MIKGISFIITQGRERMLWDILNNIDVVKYNWRNITSQQEAWIKKGEEEFLPNAFYEGGLLKQCIMQEHYIIFLKLEAYLGEIGDADISTYEEFLKSDCQILLLIYDCEFVEIYAKEQNVVEALYETARYNDFKDIGYITDETDKRKVMDIL